MLLCDLNGHSNASLNEQKGQKPRLKTWEDVTNASFNGNEAR